MDKITAVKSKLKLQQWAERIAECQTSSMTVVAWCEANNINIKSYYYWLKKVRLHTLDSMPALSEKLPEKPVESPLVFKPLEVTSRGKIVHSRRSRDALVFKPLEVTSPVAGMRASVIVHLPQATIEVPDGVSQHTVEAVLLALKATC